MEDSLSQDTIWTCRQWRDLLDQLSLSWSSFWRTYDIDRLGKTCQSQIIMLPNKDVQPSNETKHVTVVVDLGQTILSMTFKLIPDIPLVECDLDRSGG